MNCINCGAALPPKSSICTYCGGVNDIDLRGAFAIAAQAPDSTRRCPHCETALETINLGAGQPFLIERCPHCLGMFFDPSELDALVATRAEATGRVDFARLDRLTEEKVPDESAPVRYIKCPICHELMNRRRFGTRAGVVLDECADHGIWLDGGELSQILAWVRAGGPEHQAAMERERRRQETRDQKMQSRLNEPSTWNPDADNQPGTLVGSLLIDALGWLLRR